MWVNIGLGNDFDAWRHQAITWTNVGFPFSDVLWHEPESNFAASAYYSVILVWKVHI